jgi:hypothetical protein
MEAVPMSSDLCRELIELLKDEDILRLRHRARKRGRSELAELLSQEFDHREKTEKEKRGLESQKQK